MAPENLTIWCNCKLTDEALDLLKTGVGAHQLIRSEKIVNNLVAGQPDPRLAEADVAFGQPDAGQVKDLAQLKFIQLSSAGYARYDRPDLRDALKSRGAILCNSSAVYAECCAQHALAFMLCQARQIPSAIANQLQSRAWPGAQLRTQSRLLNGQTVLIIGYGAIGSRLAEFLTPLNMQINAVRRNVRGDEAVPTRPITSVNDLLPTTDHVINILPAGPGTDRFFDAARFSLMKRGASFYNIGRGATVDQSALAQALTTGHLASAYLDVTDPEPLPPVHPLWTAPNCHITPHTAGGAADEFDRVVMHFLENLKLFTSGQALRDRVF